MGDNNFFNFPSFSFLMQKRFLKLLPDIARLKFNFTNKKYFHQCSTLENKFEMVDELIIDINKCLPNKSTFEPKTSLENYNILPTKKLKIICSDSDWPTRKLKLPKEIGNFMLITTQHLNIVIFCS